MALELHDQAHRVCSLPSESGYASSEFGEFYTESASSAPRLVPGSDSRTSHSESRTARSESGTIESEFGIPTAI